ncbi:MAG: hybrid sensor histidine kinase/response regulator [Flavobacteriales bacterium]|jgi:signal transduction histidine kinase
MINNYLKIQSAKEILGMPQWKVPFSVHVVDSSEKAIKLEQENQELKQTIAKLQDIIQIKSDHLASLAHEVRTPLNAINGLVELFSHSNLSIAQLSQVEVIKNASDTMISMINDVLDFAKLEAGKIILHQSNFSLKDTIKSAVKLFEPQAEKKALFITASCDEKLDNLYYGDKQRINQILYNLVSNAIKFTEIGGVDVVCQLYTRRNKIDMVRIAVRDSGIGMSESFLQKIGNQFEQETKKSRHAHGGTGLGLHITKNLVALMNGNMKIESDEGRGTYIEIILPLEKATQINETNLHCSEEDIELLKDARVLVVEDYEWNRVLLEGAIGPIVKKLDEAENGHEAIRKLLSQDYDIILMDAHMPMMNGVEATRYIRNILNIQTPIIALTATAVDSEIQNCLKAGMNDFLIKPYSLQNLIATISKCLSR